MMVQGRQKSLISLWGLPEPVSRDPETQKAPENAPCTNGSKEHPGRLTFSLPNEVLAQIQSREQKQESRDTPTKPPSRDLLKLTFKVAPDQLRQLADRKPPPKKVVHPFFQKKPKKASHVTPEPPKHHVTPEPKPSHVVQSVGPVSRVPKKAPTSWLGVKKEKKKQTTPFPDHALYHVIPDVHTTNSPEKQRLSFQKRYSRNVNAFYKDKSQGTVDLKLPEREKPALHLPTRHVLTADGLVQLAKDLCGDLVSDPAIQTLLSRVTTLSAFDTADRESQMWVDKYRPRSREALVGNSKHVTNIVSWLKTRISRRTCLVKSSHHTPSSDFIVDDDAVMTYDNVSETDPLLLVLSGPPSSGKKASLIAACAEMDLFVFKLNATTRRTQKELMSALQGLGGSQLVNHKQKSCIILIEDVDVLYEDEKGFWGVLEKVLEKSKVPVVVTTSDVTIEREFPPSFEGHVVWETFERSAMKEEPVKETVVQTSRESSIAPPSSPQERRVTPQENEVGINDVLPTYLSLLCLCEGYEVSTEDVSALLTKYSRDIRQTINHLQLWCQMGVGDPLGGFNWVIPISEGEGKRVVSGNMFVGTQGEQTNSCDTIDTSIKSLLDKYDNACIYDIYTNSFHSGLDQTMSAEEHSALAHDTPLGWRCLEEDTVGESDPLEWEIMDMMEGLSLEDKSRDGLVSPLNSYADRVELKNLLFDETHYYSQVNTVSMTTIRTQILPYLRCMAQADLFYQNQFEVQQAQLTGRKSRRSMAAMGISIPVTHLEWDLDSIMETKMDIDGLYDR
ncbi:Telomere length regulation protein [Yarrowia sp. B02]|nr:Telomere length regulation protein [Yarrowia sp. B02]